MIKVIVVEDHQIIRRSLQVLLNASPEVEVVETVASAKDLLLLLKDGIQADIVISDVLMANRSGITTIAEIKLFDENLKVIILSTLEKLTDIQLSFEAGAKGYLSKDVGESELLFALKHVNQNHRYLSSELSIKILNQFKNQIKRDNEFQIGSFVVNDREKLVLEMIADGLTNQEISDKIFLSRRTAEGIRQSLISRSGCRNSASLIRFAVLHGYVN